MNQTTQVALGSLVGVGLGVAGTLLLRPAPACRCDLPAGHYYRVGDEVYVDEPFVRWLRSGVEPIARTWLVFPLKRFGIFLREVDDPRRRLPGQEGLLYEVRQQADNDNDRQVDLFLDALLRLGAVAHGGHFQSWADVSNYYRAAIRRAAGEPR